MLNIKTDPYLADNSPVPEVEEEISSPAMMESDGDLPGQVIESEDPGSDTDLDNLADGPKQSDVEHFASMLQEAQHIAVEIRRGEEERKRKMPKTYRGNSKKTQYRRKKARKALVSKGFLGLADFMALKKKEAPREARAQEAHESADSDVVKVGPSGANPAPGGIRVPVFTAKSGRAGSKGVISVEDDEGHNSPGSELETGTSAHEDEQCHGTTVPSRHSGLARFSGYRRAGSWKAVREEEEEEDGDDEGAPASEMEVRANELEVERPSGTTTPSKSGHLGLAHFPGYRLAGGRKLVKEEEEEDDNNDAPASECAVLEVERRSGPSVPSRPGHSGLARFPGYRLTGGRKLVEEEEEEDNDDDAPGSEHAVLEVEHRSGPSVPSRPLGVAPGPSSVAVSWTAHRQSVVMAEDEESAPASESEPEISDGAGACRVEWPIGATAPTRTLGLRYSAGPSRTGGREPVMVEEEEEDSPESVPPMDAEAHEVGLCSGGSAPSENLGSSASGGPSVDAVDLFGLESHLDGREDNLRDGDSDDDEGDDGAQKVATSTLKAILDALRAGQDPTHIVPNTPFDRALDLWKDHEKLGQARMSLAAKCKDARIDVFLRTCLTGMLGVLNLYLDPVLHHTWTEASLIVSRIQGSGEKQAHNLRQWILDFIR
ncbi:hypothetical protein V8E53_012635, partial [Lactarius tabidus]